ncbi:Zn-ribbon domain-containing OB-fold protein [Methylobacterium nonmethylotrophicum]|uniref:DNA-binding protein n=1 Tax=Methylobacterium nonmethylotrophicum TaxID=1141884 RepID=A0A4Z0NNP4_9HYPH|nr:OB-fold domain-containing protein [Methylobacterium nonmethylotrophicum]TGD98315.1 DNA-binding protein [Methylobacterium nonmethylotrophicum]
MSAEIPDWTTGGEGLTLARCRACRHVQYVRRPFCPECGSEDLSVERASGRGTVYAVTVVARAPSADLSAHAPYGIALVDAEEGFRFMAHCPLKGVAIGDAVRTTFRAFGAGLVPFVAPEGTP